MNPSTIKDDNFFNNQLLKFHIEKVAGKYLGKDVEIEARLGTINSRLTKERIFFKVAHPVIFKDLPLEMDFDATVKEQDFKKIKRNLLRSISLPTDTLNNTPTTTLINTPTTTLINTPTTTLINTPNNTHYTVVDTKDTVTIGENKIRKICKQPNDENKPKIQQKIRLENLTIYLPSSKYDLRLSVSREIDLPLDKFKESKYPLKRSRSRTSVENDGICYDFTKINLRDQIHWEVEVENKGEFEIQEFYESILRILQ